MRVIATLLVRDEEEIVKECIEHHLNNGVDAFIVTDNGSVDRTREIVNDCANVISIIDEPIHNMHQSRWVTRMARMAANMHSDWVVHIDADEFWYGLNILHTQALKGIGVLTVKKEYKHVPVEGLEFGTFVRQQMPYYRQVKSPMPKVIHRVSSRARISHGNHIVGGVSGRNIIAPSDIYIRHYPIRSYKHFESKTIKGGTSLHKHPGVMSNGKRWRNWYKAWKQGKLSALYAEQLYTQERIAIGLSNGELSCLTQ